jgi:hypothetical protein
MFMIPLFALFLFGPALADEVAFTQNAVEVKNRSGHPIACAAQLAHWFSADLGIAAPGDALRIDFEADPVSGTVFIRNAGGERMPIEAAWCGLEGRAWETRYQFDLVRAGGRGLTCEAVAEGRLACR